jgi:hypothetical protein
MNYGYDVILDLWGMFGCFEYKLAWFKTWLKWQIAISASNTGGAWDNAKKYIEVKIVLPSQIWFYCVWWTFGHATSGFVSLVPFRPHVEGEFLLCQEQCNKQLLYFPTGKTENNLSFLVAGWSIRACKDFGSKGIRCPQGSCNWRHCWGSIEGYIRTFSQYLDQVDGCGVSSVCSIFCCQWRMVVPAVGFSLLCVCAHAKQWAGLVLYFPHWE